MSATVRISCFATRKWNVRISQLRFAKVLLGLCKRRIDTTGMWKKKRQEKGLPDHVHFTEGDHRPYIKMIDLVDSPQFRSLMRNQAERRKDRTEVNSDSKSEN